MHQILHRKHQRRGRITLRYRAEHFAGFEQPRAPATVFRGQRLQTVPLETLEILKGKSRVTIVLCGTRRKIACKKSSPFLGIQAVKVHRQLNSPGQSWFSAGSERLVLSGFQPQRPSGK
jgi:hypothetical protein